MSFGIGGFGGFSVGGGYDPYWGSASFRAVADNFAWPGISFQSSSFGFGLGNYFGVGFMPIGNFASFGGYNGFWGGGGSFMPGFGIGFNAWQGMPGMGFYFGGSIPYIPYGQPIQPLYDMNENYSNSGYNDQPSSKGSGADQGTDATGGNGGSVPSAGAGAGAGSGVPAAKADTGGTAPAPVVDKKAIAAAKKDALALKSDYLQLMKKAGQLKKAWETDKTEKTQVSFDKLKKAIDDAEAKLNEWRGKANAGGVYNEKFDTGEKGKIAELRVFLGKAEVAKTAYVEAKALKAKAEELKGEYKKLVEKAEGLKLAWTKGDTEKSEVSYKILKDAVEAAEKARIAWNEKATEAGTLDLTEGADQLVRVEHLKEFLVIAEAEYKGTSPAQLAAKAAEGLKGEYEALYQTALKLKTDWEKGVTPKNADNYTALKAAVENAEAKYKSYIEKATAGKVDYAAYDAVEGPRVKELTDYLPKALASIPKASPLPAVDEVAQYAKAQIAANGWLSPVEQAAIGLLKDKPAIDEYIAKAYRKALEAKWDTACGDSKPFIDYLITNKKNYTESVALITTWNKQILAVKEYDAALTSYKVKLFGKDGNKETVKAEVPGADTLEKLSTIAGRTTGLPELNIAWTIPAELKNPWTEKYNALKGEAADLKAFGTELAALVATQKGKVEAALGEKKVAGLAAGKALEEAGKVAGKLGALLTTAQELFAAYKKNPTDAGLVKVVACKGEAEGLVAQWQALMKKAKSADVPLEPALQQKVTAIGELVVQANAIDAEQKQLLAHAEDLIGKSPWLSETDKDELKKQKTIEAMDKLVAAKYEIVSADLAKVWDAKRCGDPKDYIDYCLKEKGMTVEAAREQLKTWSGQIITVLDYKPALEKYQQQLLAGKDVKAFEAEIAASADPDVVAKRAGAPLTLPVPPKKPELPGKLGEGFVATWQGLSENYGKLKTFVDTKIPQLVATRKQAIAATAGLVAEKLAKKQAGEKAKSIELEISGMPAKLTTMLVAYKANPTPEALAEIQAFTAKVDGLVLDWKAAMFKANGKVVETTAIDAQVAKVKGLIAEAVAYKKPEAIKIADVPPPAPAGNPVDTTAPVLVAGGDPIPEDNPIGKAIVELKVKAAADPALRTQMDYDGDKKVTQDELIAYQLFNGGFQANGFKVSWEMTGKKGAPSMATIQQKIAEVKKAALGQKLVEGTDAYRLHVAKELAKWIMMPTNKGGLGMIEWGQLTDKENGDLADCFANKKGSCSERVFITGAILTLAGVKPTYTEFCKHVSQYSKMLKPNETEEEIIGDPHVQIVIFTAGNKINAIEMNYVKESEADIVSNPDQMFTLGTGGEYQVMGLGNYLGALFTNKSCEMMRTKSYKLAMEYADMGIKLNPLWAPAHLTKAEALYFKEYSKQYELMIPKKIPYTYQADDSPAKIDAAKKAALLKFETVRKEVIAKARKLALTKDVIALYAKAAALVGPQNKKYAHMSYDFLKTLRSRLGGWYKSTMEQCAKAGDWTKMSEMAEQYCALFQKVYGEKEANEQEVAQFYLVRAIWGAGKKEAALDKLLVAIEVSKLPPDVFGKFETVCKDMLGHFKEVVSQCLEGKDYPKAIALQKKLASLALKGGNVDEYIYLADIMMQAGKRKEAVTLLTSELLGSQSKAGQLNLQDLAGKKLTQMKELRAKAVKKLCDIYIADAKKAIFPAVKGPDVLYVAVEGLGLVGNDLMAVRKAIEDEGLTTSPMLVGTYKEVDVLMRAADFQKIFMAASPSSPDWKAVAAQGEELLKYMDSPEIRINLAYAYKKCADKETNPAARTALLQKAGAHLDKVATLEPVVHAGKKLEYIAVAQALKKQVGTL